VLRRLRDRLEFTKGLGFRLGALLSVAILPIGMISVIQTLHLSREYERSSEIALLGRTATALRCWRSQAPQWDSPNAGPVMAAGAGALQVQLGGAAIYHGVEEQRPQLGEGAPAQARDIERALNLVYFGVLLWLVGLVIGGFYLA